MKKQIFDSYAKCVAEEFSIPHEMLFTKSKDRDCTAARHMLYYLCAKRPMKITVIAEYMAKHGYEIGHSSIIYGIKQTSKKLREDRDYIRAARRIEEQIK